MVSDGWVFVHTEEQPLGGYGLIVPGTAGYGGSSRQLFIHSSPRRRSLKPGEAQEVQFVLVGTEDPAELAAITAAIEREPRASAHVLVSNPTARRLEATLCVQAPDGRPVQPAQVPVSLEPGQAVVTGFTWAAGDKGGAEDDRLEAVLRTGDVGEVRERAKP